MTFIYLIIIQNEQLLGPRKLKNTTEAISFKLMKPKNFDSACSIDFIHFFIGGA